MLDSYLYEGVPVLQNKLGIRSEKTLALVEAEQSLANMMLLYERGFSDFSPAGLCAIHRILFGDVYEWAGECRILNIQKAERLLAGCSVWYSNDKQIGQDLDAAFSAIRAFDWKHCTREEFVSALAHLFPPIWRVHPFWEGNTRTIVMLLTLFLESYGNSTVRQGSLFWRAVIIFAIAVPRGLDRHHAKTAGGFLLHIGKVIRRQIFCWERLWATT